METGTNEIRIRGEAGHVNCTIDYPLPDVAAPRQSAANFSWILRTSETPPAKGKTQKTYPDEPRLHQLGQSRAQSCPVAAK